MLPRKWGPSAVQGARADARRYSQAPLRVATSSTDCLTALMAVGRLGIVFVFTVIRGSLRASIPLTSGRLALIKRAMENNGTARVVVVGGGFAGLSAAKALARGNVQLTVVDRRNYHLFQPLLYQVATAALDSSDIAMPIRSILRNKDNVDVLLAEVMGVDKEKRQLLLDQGTLPYDFLLIATGAQDSYFGHEGWAGRAPGLKTLEDALEIRREIFLAFERAERETDAARRKDWLTFVLIGGGPTGVEMAGALAEISRHSLEQDFRRINPADARIVLVEGHATLLPFYPSELTDSTRRHLEKLGVEVRLGQRVTAIDAGGVFIGNEWIGARTVLWSAGVAASPLGAKLGVPLDKAGRVKVTPFLSIPGHEEIYVAGDLALVEQDGKTVAGVAPAAMQMGKHAAANILEQVHKRAPRPFRYEDRGTFAVIGRGAAVGLAYRFKLRGFVAWLAWLFIHLAFLAGFRNRIFVFFKWAYSYFTLRRYARLITGTSRSPRGDGDLQAPPVPGG